MTNPPVPFTVPPGDPAAHGLRDRDRLACDQRFVNCTRPLNHNAICWNFLAGSDPQTIPDLNAVEVYIVFDPVSPDQEGRLGRQPKEALDCTAGLTPGPEFENLATQYKGHDHGRGLE
jgi:hypothetical protein